MRDLDIPTDLLTSDEMGRADTLAIDSGISGFVLMRRAGRAVAEAVGRLAGPPGPVLVLCGPGNNGGDGFIAASLLVERGWSVRVGLLGNPDRIAGDAAKAMAAWSGPVDVLDDGACQSIAQGPAPSVVVDALIGAGLSRPFGGESARLLRSLSDAGARVVSVDVPSGLDGTTGRIAGGEAGMAVAADITVTFFRLKPGHCLYPGRSLCGRIALTDIGIEAGVLDRIGCRATINRPSDWLHLVPLPSVSDHKYSRGHVIVMAGDMPGAAVLAAQAARRIAGYVTLAGGNADDCRSISPGLVVRRGGDGWESSVRRAAVRPGSVAAVIGPGAGIDDDDAATELRRRVLGWIATAAPLVLDADGLTAFCGPENARDQGTARVDQLKAADCESRLVLTPHSGEFARLFPEIVRTDSDKLTATRQAARRAGGVVVHKGADTVVAAPDGRAAISVDAPPSLATAGTGDVLTGIVAALMSAGVAAFDAARIGVWIHAEAAHIAGPGMVAEDMTGAIGAAIQNLGASIAPRNAETKSIFDCRRI